MSVEALPHEERQRIDRFPPPTIDSEVQVRRRSLRVARIADIPEHVARLDLLLFAHRHTVEMRVVIRRPRGIQPDRLPTEAVLPRHHAPCRHCEHRCETLDEDIDALVVAFAGITRGAEQATHGVRARPDHGKRQRTAELQGETISAVARNVALYQHVIRPIARQARRETRGAGSQR